MCIIYNMCRSVVPAFKCSSLHVFSVPAGPIKTSVCLTVRCAVPPGDGTTPQGLTQAAERRSVLCRGPGHCLKVTGLVDGAVTGANGIPSRPGSCSSTMDLSVMPRLPPAVLPHTTAKMTHTLVLLTLPVCCWEIKWKFCRRFSDTVYPLATVLDILACRPYYNRCISKLPMIRYSFISPTMGK